ncbi:MAG: c-type cytochrome [Planctomycetota bacterium]
MRGRQDRFRWLWGAGVVALAVGLASCGGGDDAMNRWKDVSTAQVIRQAEPAEAGYVVFRRRQCHLCHGDASNSVAPSHHGLWGSEVRLQDGTTVIADEAYIRESILHSDRQVVAGYKSGQMANYAGILSDGEIDALVAYIESIGPGDE